jgi:hypothetical protein
MQNHVVDRGVDGESLPENEIEVRMLAEIHNTTELPALPGSRAAWSIQPHIYVSAEGDPCRGSMPRRDLPARALRQHSS